MKGMTPMMGPMGPMMVLGMLVLFALVVAAVYVGVRFSRSAGSGDSARAMLDRRFALGEIDAEDYYERESALRSTTAGAGKRRDGLAGS